MKSDTANTADTSDADDIRHVRHLRHRWHHTQQTQQTPQIQRTPPSYQFQMTPDTADKCKWYSRRNTHNRHIRHKRHTRHNIHIRWHSQAAAVHKSNWWSFPLDKSKMLFSVEIGGNDISVSGVDLWRLKTARHRCSKKFCPVKKNPTDAMLYSVIANFAFSPSLANQIHQRNTNTIHIFSFKLLVKDNQAVVNSQHEKKAKLVLC